MYRALATSLFLFGGVQGQADPEAIGYCGNFVSFSDQIDNNGCQQECSALQDDGLEEKEIRIQLKAQCKYQPWSVNDDDTLTLPPCYNSYIWLDENDIYLFSPYTDYADGPAQCQQFCQDEESCAQWAFDRTYGDCFILDFDAVHGKHDKNSPRNSKFCQGDEFDPDVCLVCDKKPMPAMLDFNWIVGDKYCASDSGPCSTANVYPPNEDPYPPYECDRCPDAYI